MESWGYDDSVSETDTVVPQYQNINIVESFV